MIMKVIDISAWQENVDWNAVVADGVEGVILKLGEAYELDEKFIEHVNNAVAVGLPYGVYYYSHAGNVALAQQEALWVDKQIKTYLNGVNPALGIWFDAEDRSMLSGDVTAAVSEFICTLNLLGYNYVGVYSSYNWLSLYGAHNIDLRQLADYVPIWVAQYNRHCDLKDELPSTKNIKIWQYSSSKTINGIDGMVDCNEYYER